jgi:hypothetical protein
VHWIISITHDVVLPPVSIHEFPQLGYLAESKPFLISISCPGISLEASRMMPGRALRVVMHCNITLRLTKYYRKKRHWAQYRVAVFFTVFGGPARVS